MTDDKSESLETKNQQLKARAYKLAEEKSYLQLVMRLIEHLNPLPGLEDMVQAMLFSIVETIGGTNIKLYHWSDTELRYRDFLGKSMTLEAIDDPIVAEVAEKHEFIEREGQGDASLMKGDVIPGAWTWAFPLLVGEELIGIIKLENVHISGKSLKKYLPIFFSHVALILSNESRNLARQKDMKALQKWVHIFEHAEWGVMVSSVDGMYLEMMNPACARMHGYEQDELIGRPVADLYTPEERPKLPEFIKTAYAEENVLFESQHLRKDGSIFPVVVDITAVKDDAGEGFYLVANIQDITERKKGEDALVQSERRYRSIFEQAAVGIAHVAPDGRWLRVNNRLCEIVGYDHNELLERTFQDITHPDDLETDLGLVKQVLDDLIKSYSMEKRYFRKDGTITWINLTVSLVREDEGQPAYFISVIEDINARKEAEIAYKKAASEAKTANHAKSEFLASMSHELRTPLNAVLGFAQLLQFDPKRPLSPTQNDHIESILSGGHHLLALVDEILDLSKIEADQFDLFLEEVNANEVIAECAGLASLLGEPRSITIIDKFSAMPPAFLHTDQLRFKQALINLLSNAVKYNRDGGTITITGEEVNKGYLRLSVTDNGFGIADEDQASVFYMFHRLDADPMMTREGTGIGLTVTKLLMDRMAGSVGLESKKGIGSTFWIELPLVSNEDVLIWTKAMRVGVDAIDKDHQVLIGLLNKVSHGDLNEIEINEVIDQLIGYIGYHFQREEAVMEACDYPDLDKHCDLHKALADQVNRLTNMRQIHHKGETPHQLSSFLRDWLFGHVINVDTDITKYAEGREQDIHDALERLELVGTKHPHQDLS